MAIQCPQDSGQCSVDSASAQWQCQWMDWFNSQSCIHMYMCGTIVSPNTRSCRARCPDLPDTLQLSYHKSRRADPTRHAIFSHRPTSRLCPGVLHDSAGIGLYMANVASLLTPPRQSGHHICTSSHFEAQLIHTPAWPQGKKIASCGAASQYLWATHTHM